MTFPQAAGPSPRENSIIPAARQSVTPLYVQAFLAVLIALVLRTLLVLYLPAPSGDGALYVQLARNWADHHVYGLWLNGALVPTDLRAPGYPAFLAAVALVLGRSVRAILLSQAALDVLTCLLTACLAAALAPPSARRRIGLIALWLAALCPLLANYTAAVLTETLVTFLSTAALVAFSWALVAGPGDSWPLAHRWQSPSVLGCAGAFLTGLASLVRPEMPLLFAAAAAAFALRFWKPLRLRRTTWLGACMVAAFVLPLLPWAARNAVTLRKVQFLAPRYATIPGEYTPIGFYAWTNTWLVRFRDVYATIWKTSEESMDLDALPGRAFDSAEERNRIAALIDEYDHTPDLEITPEIDRGFAEIARERTRRNPLRTYLRVPFERVLTIWLTPRIELLPIDGKIWPLRERWEDSPVNVLVTIGFAALGYAYLVLAGAGIWFVWRGRRAAQQPWRTSGNGCPNFWAIAMIIAYLAIRTAFLTTIEAPEPRYVVTCYPAVLAFVALIGIRKRTGRQQEGPVPVSSPSKAG